MDLKLETALHQAKGLGSAKSGLHHWIAQRISALLLIPLGIWFVAAFIVFLTAPFHEARLWLLSPVVVSILILFTGATFYHGYLGLQVIWEDYVPNTSTRYFLIVATKIVSLLLTIFASICILHIFLS